MHDNLIFYSCVSYSQSCSLCGSCILKWEKYSLVVSQMPVKLDMAGLPNWSWSTQYLMVSLAQWDKEIPIVNFTIFGHRARISIYMSK